MPPITALVRTTNDALRLGRTLETLLPCAEILVVHQDSQDATRRVARQYGARIVAAEGTTTTSGYVAMARHNWIFCIEPGESMTEGLQASLYEWSVLPPPELDYAFSLLVREQVGGIWRELPGPITRLVPRQWTKWEGWLPAFDPAVGLLEGRLLRFV